MQRGRLKVRKFIRLKAVDEDFTFFLFFLGIIASKIFIRLNLVTLSIIRLFKVGLILMPTSESQSEENCLTKTDLANPNCSIDDLTFSKCRS